MLDLAAQKHDYAYWLLNKGGADGAFFDLAVKQADIELSKSALLIIVGYNRGEKDPVTHNRISDRTYNEAKLVLALFGPISGSKIARDAIPSPINSVSENLRTGFNNFINNIVTQIKTVH